MTKKVAVMECFFRMSRISGVSFGSGPSSKVRAIESEYVGALQNTLPKNCIRIFLMPRANTGMCAVHSDIRKSLCRGNISDAILQTANEQSQMKKGVICIG